MKKKILALCLVVALLATAIAGATLAYFTDTDEVNNTFTVGNIEIKLDEAPVGDDGLADKGDRVQENEYHLYPGMTYDKDPMVTVIKGSEECYVRVFMSINNQDKLDEQLAGYKIEDILTGTSEKWEYKGNVREGDVRTYEFWYTEKIDATEADEDIALDPLFKNIVVPAGLTNEQMTALNDLKINVVAHAMQTEGFSTADEAWDKWPG